MLQIGDLYPIITYAAQQREVTAWTEDDSVPIVPPLVTNRPCTLPTGSLYSNPPVKVIPDQVITFSQYESAFGPETMFERIYKLNDAVWKVDSSGSSSGFNAIDPRHAMIADIAYEETTVPLVAGPHTCYRVTYTIHVRDWTLKGLADDTSIVDLNPGWDQPRVRADTRYLNSNLELKPSANFGTWGHQQLYLKENSPSPWGGEPFAQPEQNGIPPYDILKVQPQIDFSFLG